MLRIDRIELLTFYDDPSHDEQGMSATAVNAMAGEELGLALLLRYLADSGIAAEQLPGSCTTGRRRGHRLDAWISAPDVLYQVEVKNWSAHSFGGSHFPLDATASEACAHRVRVWNEYWNGSTFTDPPAAKVLEPMKTPDQHAKIEPLIAFWVALHPEGKADPFFRVPLADKHFGHVNVFSMSTYLRTLTVDYIELPLPNTRIRLDVLDRIFPRT